jgi:F0F1-type ATP synthase assembly protein I
MGSSGDEGPSGRSESNEILRASSQFLGHGMAFALSTLAFLLLGNWADGKLGTGPILAIVGTLVGGSAGFYSLYRHVMAANAPPEGDDDEGRP